MRWGLAWVWVVLSSGALGLSAAPAAKGAAQVMASSVDPPPWRDPRALHAALASCEDPALGPKIRSALAVLTDAVRIFGADAVYCSFNGGKDAVVVLHLLRAALASSASANGDVAKDGCAPSPSSETTGNGGLRPSFPAAGRPKLLYFDATDDFDEMRAFVRETVDVVAQQSGSSSSSLSEFTVELIKTETGFVDGLRDLVARAKPRPLAFVLGTRRGDPNCGDQQAFEPSSSWMPPFMRVNPILDWTYGDVWDFLRRFHLPYCALYDDGYTSLGTRATTLPNPLLANPDGTFRPASDLADWSAERAGRKPKATNKKNS